MPHRYWRLGFQRGDSTNNAYVSLSEIELRDSIGGADLTGSGTPSVSNTSSGTAADLFDNNTATSWTVNLGLDEVRVTYDFGAPVDVVEVLLRASSDAAQIGFRRPYATLGCSDDGITWSILGPPIDTKALHSSTSTTVVVSGFGPVVEPHVAGARGILLDTAWPADTAQGHVVGVAIHRDEYDGGALQISGTVMLDDTPDVPVRRKVRLFEKQSGRLVRETFSDPVTGAYSFDRLKYQKYFVVSHDHALEYNAVIKDEITPEPA